MNLFPIKVVYLLVRVRFGTLKRRPERASISASPERGARQIQSSDKTRTPVQNQHLEQVSLESNLYEGSNHLDSQSRVTSAFSGSLSSTTTFLHAFQNPCKHPSSKEPWQATGTNLIQVTDKKSPRTRDSQRR